MNLVKNVEDFLFKRADEISCRFYQYVLADMEGYEEQERAITSPVEQLFYIVWYSKWFMFFEAERISFKLEPQYKDESTGKYRLDFHADFLGYLMDTHAQFKFNSKALVEIDPPKLGIEIDGHIWHEKSKKQVQYDKERERFLIANGWKLLRFTGSEVFKNPEDCVKEAINLGRKLTNEWYKKLREFEKNKQ